MPQRVDCHFTLIYSTTHICKTCWSQVRPTPDHTCMGVLHSGCHTLLLDVVASAHRPLTLAALDPAAVQRAQHRGWRRKVQKRSSGCCCLPPLLRPPPQPPNRSPARRPRRAGGAAGSGRRGGPGRPGAHRAPTAARCAPPAALCAPTRHPAHGLIPGLPLQWGHMAGDCMRGTQAGGAGRTRRGGRGRVAACRRRGAAGGEGCVRRPAAARPWVGGRVNGPGGGQPRVPSEPQWTLQALTPAACACARARRRDGRAACGGRRARPVHASRCPAARPPVAWCGAPARTRMGKSSVPACHRCCSRGPRDRYLHAVSHTRVYMQGSVPARAGGAGRSGEAAGGAAPARTRAAARAWAGRRGGGAARRRPRSASPPPRCPAGPTRAPAPAVGVGVYGEKRVLQAGAPGAPAGARGAAPTVRAEAALWASSRWAGAGARLGGGQGHTFGSVPCIRPGGKCTMSVWPHGKCLRAGRAHTQAGHSAATMRGRPACRHPVWTATHGTLVARARTQACPGTAASAAPARSLCEPVPALRRAQGRGPARRARLGGQRGGLRRPRQQARARAAVGGGRPGRAGRRVKAAVRALVPRPVGACQAHRPAVVHQRRVCARAVPMSACRRVGPALPQLRLWVAGPACLNVVWRCTCP